MKIIKAFLKYLALVYVLSLERVIGLPFLFVILSLIWFEKDKGQYFKLIGLILSQSLLLSLFFNFAWFLAWLLFLGGYIFVRFGDELVHSKRRRFLLSVLMVNLISIWTTELSLSYVTLIQLVVSYLIVLLWLRIFDPEQWQKKTSLSFKLFNPKWN